MLIMSNNTYLRLPSVIALLGALVMLSACTSHPARQSQDGAPRGTIDVTRIADAVPRVEPLARLGNPESYVVFGQRYYPVKSARGFVETGIASWYGTKFHGRSTSSGEPYSMYGMTAAHKTLPLPTYVEVTNLDNGKKIIVKVNDRGPFHDDRIIDLSYAAAMKLGYANSGTARVEIRAIDPAAPKPHPAQAAASGTDEAEADKPLYLQVGSFSSRPNAETLRQLITSMADDMPVQISQTQSPRNTLFRVRVGPLNSSAEAEKTSALLAMIGITNSHIVYD